MGKKKGPEELVMKVVGVRVPIEVERAITLIAERDSTAKSEVVRRLIEMGLTIDRQFGQRTASAA
jgi:predicted DNA-binding protein